MKNNHFYTTKDVVKKVGITRPTLYKWFKEGKIKEVLCDRNGKRLFSAKDVKDIFEYKNLIKQPRVNDFPPISDTASRVAKKEEHDAA